MSTHTRVHPGRRRKSYPGRRSYSRKKKKKKKKKVESGTTVSNWKDAEVTFSVNRFLTRKISPFCLTTTTTTAIPYNINVILRRFCPFPRR